MPPKALLAQNSKFDSQDTELALRSLGWEFVVANSVRQACDLAMKQEYQFVLLGLDFEDGTGYTIAKAIRECDNASKNALIVAIVKGEPVEIQACKQAGVDGVITNDCDSEELTAQLQKWIAKVAFRTWKSEGMPRIMLDRMSLGNQ